VETPFWIEHRRREKLVPSREWLDEIDWTGILIGVGVGTLLQAFLGLLLSIARLPVDTLFTFVFIDLSMTFAGFLSAWWALSKGKPAIPNVLVVALLCAFISLTSSALINPGGIRIVGIIVLFVGYTIFATLGGLIADYISSLLQRRKTKR
jgi:hypothetical protein